MHLGERRAPLFFAQVIRGLTSTYLEVGIPGEVILVDSRLTSSPRLISNLSLSIPTYLNLEKEGLV